MEGIEGQLNRKESRETNEGVEGIDLRQTLLAGTAALATLVASHEQANAQDISECLTDVNKQMAETVIGTSERLREARAAVREEGETFIDNPTPGNRDSYEEAGTAFEEARENTPGIGQIERLLQTCETERLFIEDDFRLGSITEEEKNERLDQITVIEANFRAALERLEAQ